MIIRPMIGEWEVPSIERIATREQRRLARLGVPGLAGDLHQDLGRQSLAVEISGSLASDQARDDMLDELRDKYLDGSPVSFVADILTATELQQVVIEELELEESNQWTNLFRYRIVLREYVEPPEPPQPLDDLGLDLGVDLDALAELGLDGLELPDLLGDLPSLADPVAPMQPALEGVRAATAGIGGLLGGLKAKLSG